MSWKALVIGGGPAGLYTSKFLKKKCRHLLKIDLLEVRPVLGGLFRYGVAPDHPLIKRSMNSFKELLEDSDSSEFNVFGNVRFTEKDFSIFREMYDNIVFANGCDSLAQIHIKGEALCNEKIINGFDMVKLYNNDYKLNENMIKLRKVRHAKTVVIIGNGNVSIDISRVLSRDWNKYEQNFPKEFLQYVDKNFLDWLSQNQFERIVIVGRRGMTQSAFSVKEFRDFLGASEWDVQISQEEFNASLNLPSLAECDIRANIRNRQVNSQFKYYYTSQAYNKILF